MERWDIYLAEEIQVTVVEACLVVAITVDIRVDRRIIRGILDRAGVMRLRRVRLEVRQEHVPLRASAVQDVDRTGKSTCIFRLLD